MPGETTLSVVLPNFNHGHLLPSALEALARQTRPAQEVVVVDDGSTDGSMDCLASLSGHFPGLKVVNLGHNQGVAAACLAGAEAAGGEYLYCGAVDDPLLPDFFAAGLEALASHPSAGIVCSDFFDILPDGGRARVSLGLGPDPAYLLPRDLAALVAGKRVFSLTTPTAVYGREAWLRSASQVPASLGWRHDWLVALLVAWRHGLAVSPVCAKEVRWDFHSTSFRGGRNPRAKREVLRVFMSLLHEPAFSDVRAYFRLPALLAPFGLTLLMLTLEDPHWRPWFSWKLLLGCLESDDLNSSLFDDPRAFDLSRERQMREARGILGDLAAQLDKQAQQCLQGGEIGSAILRLLKLRELRPSDASVHHLLGRLTAQLGWWADAQGHFEETLALDPDLRAARQDLLEVRQRLADQGESRP